MSWIVSKRSCHKKAFEQVMERGPRGEGEEDYETVRAGTLLKQAKGGNGLESEERHPEGRKNLQGARLRRRREGNSRVSCKIMEKKARCEGGAR